MTLWEKAGTEENERKEKQIKSRVVKAKCYKEHFQISIEYFLSFTTYPLSFSLQSTQWQPTY